ncbi:MAG: diacylglyceryl transferase [Bacteroidetes bacterium MED-G17]|nr:MAG: diacylglyceryl transferase [Bacteroidetes bacterium MED-G17]|tara:strand:- start:1449 stop:1766 length:318 start_codon:yes stop_codon:yes gene_type:complete
MKRIWKKLKQKWGVESDLRMLWLFLLFAIAGSTTAYLRNKLFVYIGIAPFSPKILYVLFKFVFIYFFYQICLLTVGSLGGEFRFYWPFLRKMNQRMIARFSKKDD